MIGLLVWSISLSQHNHSTPTPSHLFLFNQFFDILLIALVLECNLPDLRTCAVSTNERFMLNMHLSPAPRINIKHHQATPTVKHSLRKEASSPLSKISENEDTITSVLGVKSFKMKGLEDLLIGSKKFSTHTVSLQLTAQSQVHLSRKRQSIGNEGVTGYSGRIKKPKKFFE